MDRLKQLFSSSVEQMQLPISAEQILQYLEYIALLQKWNKAYNLTAIRDPEEMLVKHLLDSLSIHHAVQGQVLDVGTGAGFPGLPLAIASPAQYYTLLDCNNKKIRFLTQVIIELGLRNVQAVHGRVEELPKQQQFSCITTRAFAPLSDMLVIDTNLLQKHGQLLAMKGEWLKEDQTPPTGYVITKVEKLTVPHLDAVRHLITLEPLHQASKDKH